MASRSVRNNIILMLLIVLAAVAVPMFQSRPTEGRSLVVYCSHDSIFADSIIRQFEDRSGIRVEVRYDEETNKSLGLTNLLIAEKNAPRCDVFWNNQTLGTIRLKKLGLLAPCDPKLFERIPEQFRDADHCWCGFSARFRVYIVNTERMSATEEAIAAAIHSESLSSMAIAVPLFGTTLTHYALLADQLGLDGLKAWHESLRNRGAREVRGNAAVKDLVAEGACDFGLTDTDDAFAAIDAGKPVAMLPVRVAERQTIGIPNSVALIRNAPHPEEAIEFIEYLLSEEVELALAQSASRQVPLGPVTGSKLPEAVRNLLPWVASGASLEGASRQDADVLQWLTNEYAGQ